MTSSALSAGAALRKNAAEVAAGQAEPLCKAAEYADAIMTRAGEIAVEKGCTPGQTRPCLRCRRPFESEGIHHRLCYPCSTESVSPYAVLTKHPRIDVPQVACMNNERLRGSGG